MKQISADAVQQRLQRHGIPVTAFSDRNDGQSLQELGRDASEQVPRARST
jgi:hypothetical protein